ncbi:MAG: GWxTD domain-containing protein [Melioribacteraceae bacterium]|nr:GWxTD domain-containing protein [Melioribacteraceae bacterium]MDD3557476.1 GWxTD domain-containing protein [Melioribacteraceae bacterium]
MKKLAAIFLILSGFVFAQPENSSGALSHYSPNFFIDFLDYKSNLPGKTKVDVLIQLPYSSVQFVKEGKSFFSRYTIFLTFYDGNKNNVMFEKIWKENIETEDFEETYSSQNFNISHRSFDLTPQKYVVVCAVEDMNSGQRILFETELRVRKLEEVDISDIMFIKSIVLTESGSEIVPNVSNILASNERNVTMLYEIYSDKDQSVSVKHTITDQSRDINHYNFVTFELKKGLNTLQPELKEIPLKLGEFIMLVEVEDTDENKICSTGKNFRATIDGFPKTIVDLDEAIKQMKYFVNESKIDSLLDIQNYDERLKEFITFWKERDPSPTTLENELLNEYYRRIDYANKNFKGFYEGWQTDMGMVYVTLGPPNQVNREPVSIDSKPYEIWDYYDINRRFLFVDHTGFGDYRLENPQYGEWNHYRR